MILRLVFANLLFWGIALLLPGLPVNIALLAWTLGLRHALDADHISAIDAVSRQMMLRKRSAEWIGIYFSIGHSMVVFLATCAAGWYASSAVLHAPPIIGSEFGAMFSAGFLILMGCLNLAGLFRSSSAMHSKIGGRFKVDLVSRLSRPCGMAGVGFLFGLGFDTASEIGLVALAAMHYASMVAVVLIPLLFAAGMILVDGLDSYVMVRLWSRPNQRVYYRRAVTLVSAALALLVGGQELLPHVMSMGKTAITFETWFETHVTQIGLSIIIIYIALYVSMKRGTLARRSV